LAELQQPNCRVKTGRRDLAALESIEEETFSMNKKLMALAVASAVAVPGLAVAQTSLTPTAIVPSPGVASSNGITLYGRLDETIISSKYSATPGFTGASAAGQSSELKKGDVWSPGNAMGIRGREDLGGGTAAWFQLEIGVWPSERLDTATTTGNNWGGRNSAIGISSQIGDILVGNWDTPYKQTFGVWNSVTSGGFSAAGIIVGNGDTTGALNNALC
jgi:predicted porin